MSGAVEPAGGPGGSGAGKPARQGGESAEPFWQPTYGDPLLFAILWLAAVDHRFRAIVGAGAWHAGRRLTRTEVLGLVSSTAERQRESAERRADRRR